MCYLVFPLNFLPGFLWNWEILTYTIPPQEHGECKGGSEIEEQAISIL